mmetsp:Transcript_4592/g.9924  ORF Transcript_4592/g.9924 Transcript_4592/m.9924 type:complete len:399 (+) Transcript_4592:48-1244(+)|eukprot:CAMPEP_0202902160 /NCGR_PEP_ID=MMETSP1392-20130828/16661_1 /ASSEMBLY_ACC=CAM_ASM_000868 /TAXON_ID=225041 /ORGANISM="Chlamydomonas chlamydogama, Strain SAG 11-48b" /LENGTH=398 /DNA_ID=CAMNT_0049588885 /DNA_START=18 /DNA_END=1214 /DNA_ORIENTATION=-
MLLHATTARAPCARQFRSAALVIQIHQHCARPVILHRETEHSHVSVRSPAPVVLKKVGRVVCKSMAADAGSGSNPKGNEDAAKETLFDTLFLGALFGGWYACNIIFNIYNKTSLKLFPHPLTLTTVQFMVGALISVACWTTGLVQRPKITLNTVKSVMPLAVVHTLGNLLTNVSLGAVAVSFTHTIKAMEPFFSVLLSALFLGDKPSLPILLCLVPIMGGVAAASMTEASFNWTGFLSAMGSNLTFQSRNVLSKKLMLKKDESGSSLDNMNLFSLITIASFILLLPVSLALEGWGLTPAALAAAGVANPNRVFQQALMAALCFHGYQQISYMILQRVSPVTHSVGNCVKRVVVIVASVLVFRNPVSMQNAVGTAIALAGVFAYSQVKRMKLGSKVKAE